jgi:hypothetical protein
MALSMGKENGSLQRALNVTNMKEITVKTKSMGLAYFNGQVVTYTKENTKMMREMATEK